MAKLSIKTVPDIKKQRDIDLFGVARIDESAPAEVRKSAEALLPGSRSVVVIGKEIYGEIVSLLKPSKEVGEADPGALLNPHYAYLNGRITKTVYDVAEQLRREGYRTMPLPPADCPTDQRTLIAIFPFKHAAVAAGLGTIGRNGLLITKDFGPRVRLACLLTDAPLESTPLPEKNFCNDCHACIRACPAGALQPPTDGGFYSINKFACQTYRHSGLVCSMCMKACHMARS